MSMYLRPRRGRKAAAIAQGIILKKGEIFFESPDTGTGTGAGKIKIGDGSTTYADLPYFNDGTISGGGITSIGLSVPTGFNVSGSPLTENGTITITMEDGYSVPTIEKQNSWDSKYTKPSDGITKTDLASDVQTSLEKADSALQSESDPTVPNWAKQDTKPEYDASEISGLGPLATKNKVIRSDLSESIIDAVMKAENSLQPDIIKSHEDIEYINYPADNDKIANMEFLAYWNGAWSAENYSNLAYCKKGEFGDVITHNSNEFSPNVKSIDIVTSHPTSSSRPGLYKLDELTGLDFFNATNKILEMRFHKEIYMVDDQGSGYWLCNTHDAGDRVWLESRADGVYINIWDNQGELLPDGIAKWHVQIFYI